MTWLLLAIYLIGVVALYGAVVAFQVRTWAILASDHMTSFRVVAVIAAISWPVTVFCHMIGALVVGQKMWRGWMK